jgi:hypothetical protein
MLSLRALAARCFPRVAIIFTMCVTAGYAVGTILVIYRLYQGEIEMWGLFPKYTYGDDLLFKYRNFYRSTYGSLADYLDTLVTTCMACLFILLAASVGGVWSARLVWRWLIPTSCRNSPSMDVPTMRVMWRQAVDVSLAKARAPVVAVLFGLGGFCLGLSGAWVGLWTDTMAYHHRIAAAFRQVGPNRAFVPPASPAPILGIYTNAPPMVWGDAIWVIGGTWLATFLLATVPARRRLIRDNVLADKWCRKCGYPRPTAHSSDGSSGQRTPRVCCPECGSVESAA